MGTWGPAIFSDDFAMDLRDEFREAIANGQSAQQALDLLKLKYKDSLDDPDEGPVFWLALAATAWKIGRLDDALRDKALAIIAVGEGLDRWDDAKLRAQREKVLADLAEQLRSPQGKPVKFKKKAPLSTDWLQGEVLGYQLPTGKWLLIHVIGVQEQQGHRYPLVEVYDWRDKSVPPDPSALASAHAARIGKYPTAPLSANLMLARKSDASRFVRWGIRKEPRWHHLGGLARRVGLLPKPNSKSHIGRLTLEAIFDETPGSSRTETADDPFL